MDVERRGRVALPRDAWGVSRACVGWMKKRRDGMEGRNGWNVVTFARPLPLSHPRHQRALVCGITLLAVRLGG